MVVEPKLLATFREIAVRGSFSAAAGALGYTQPAVSQHVARLERRLGVRLLERDAGGVRLTPAGEALLPHADAILGQLRRAAADVRSAAGQAAPKLSIGAFGSAAATLIPRAARALRSQQPLLELHLDVVEVGPALERLATGQLDVAITADAETMPAAELDGIEHLHVCDDPMLVALPSDHSLATRASVALDELRDEAWLLTALDGRCVESFVAIQACRAAGFTPDAHAETEDYQALQGLVAAGLGVALIPFLATLTPHPDVALRRLSGPPLNRRILASVRREREPLVDHLVAELRDAARRLAVQSGGELRLAA